MALRTHSMQRKGHATPRATVNGVSIHYELAEPADRITAASEPLVLVHGSWVDHHVWDVVTPALASSQRVLRFDRRGHGISERTPGNGGMQVNAEDLAALIVALDLGPAHIVGVSWGGSIALALAATRPDLFLSLSVHEPPLFALASDNGPSRDELKELSRSLETVVKLLSAGDFEAGARTYVDQVAQQPGTWSKLPQAVRDVYLDNAPAYLDQCLSADQWSVDLEALRSFPHHALLTEGDLRGSIFHHALDRLAEVLPETERRLLPGTAHRPQLTHPAAYAEALLVFTQSVGRAVPTR